MAQQLVKKDDDRDDE
ncbi:hypothetical protein A2U01_0002397, partial [Trifolium medium]|nr:hypothetical protein [Trifolium medium]